MKRIRTLNYTTKLRYRLKPKMEENKNDIVDNDMHNNNNNNNNNS